MPFMVEMHLHLHMGMAVVPCANPQTPEVSLGCPLMCLSLLEAPLPVASNLRHQGATVSPDLFFLSPAHLSPAVTNTDISFEV